MRYMRERRTALGGYLPARKSTAPPLAMPALEAFSAMLEGTRRSRDLAPPWRSCAFSTVLLKDKNIGKNIVPIVPDEARTFGMEGLFRQIGIYSARSASSTRRRMPRRSMSYREDKKGQMLEEGINEAGSAVLVDRRRHGLREPRHQHGAVLHLLLDVRLPARRRFHLGRGRHPGARLPAGRHRRPHHARRRRSAAPGRPQPAAREPPCPIAWPTTRPMPTSSP